MKEQDELFYDDFRSAIRHLIDALGRPKRVGALLRPNWPMQRATDWVNDCLNPNRDTKFDLEDISALLKAGRERGIHCALWQLCDETGYTHPAIAPTKTPNQERAEKMAHLLAEFRRLADEEAAEKHQLKAVS